MREAEKNGREQMKRFGFWEFPSNFPGNGLVFFGTLFEVGFKGAVEGPLEGCPIRG